MFISQGNYNKVYNISLTISENCRDIGHCIGLNGNSNWIEAIIVSVCFHLDQFSIN